MESGEGDGSKEMVENVLLTWTMAAAAGSFVGAAAALTLDWGMRYYLRKKTQSTQENYTPIRGSLYNNNNNKNTNRKPWFGGAKADKN